MSSSASFKTFYAQVAGVADVAYVYPFRDDEDEEHEGGDADGGEGGEDAAGLGERVLTCGADCSVQLRVPLGDEVEQEISDHLDGINALAVSPVGGKFVTGSDDHAVKLYSYPECENIASLARFTLPVRTVCFSHDGAQIAAAGDDEGVKILSAQDASVVRVIHGVSSVKHLTYDPKGDWLIVGTCDGVLVAYDTDAGMKRNDWGEVLPKVKPKSTQMNKFAFDPAGAYLAVPGKSNEVIVYERDSWREAFTLAGTHTQAVGVLCWSPNGRFLVSAGVDKLLVVWDVAKKAAVATQQTEAVVCGLSWQRGKNCIASIDCEGNLGFWTGAVPSGCPSPVEMMKTGSGVDAAAYFFDDEADDDGDDDGDDGEDDVSGDVLAGAENDDEDVGVLNNGTDSGAGAKSVRQAPAAALIQRAFQPNATRYSGNPPRKFLAFNLLGSVISRDEGTYNVIEVSFHDTGVRMGRIPAMSDYYGFTMAALNEQGVALASPGAGETLQSTLMFRPFESWAGDSDWELQLPFGSKFCGVAVGKSWVAATTSQNELRIFSSGGLQTFVMTLEGPPVSISSDGDLLSVVWHGAAAASGSDQRLSYMVVDVAAQERLHHGPFPISAGAKLTWLGFASGGRLASGDSSGVVRMRVGEFGGSWMPVITGVDGGAAGDSMWVVGIEETSLTYIKCRGNVREPAVLPKPVLDECPLSAPVIKEKSERMDELQQALLRDSTYLNYLKGRAGSLSEEDDVEIEGAEKQMDRTLLKLAHEACKSDQLVRALEAVGMLNCMVSLNGALKLANNMRLPALAEKIGVLIQTREELEAMAEEDYDIDTFKIRSTAMDSIKTPAPNPFSRTAAPSPAPLAKPALDTDARRTPVLHTPAPGTKRPPEKPPVNPFSRKKLVKQNER